MSPAQPAFVPPGLSNVVAIAGGDSHSLALKSDGTVAAWGGQTSIPARLTNVVAIAAGSTHSLALRADGTVVAWGLEPIGNPTPPPWLSNVVAISTETWHNLALRADGTVVAWGSNAFGQLGDGSSLGVITRNHRSPASHDGYGQGLHQRLTRGKRGQDQVRLELRWRRVEARVEHARVTAARAKCRLLLRFQQRHADTAARQRECRRTADDAGPNDGHLDIGCCAR